LQGKTIKYAIKRGNKYLQRIEPNENYSWTGTAPTMSVRHSYNEFNTLWSKDVYYIEPLTVMNYIKILFEEYRWNNKKPMEIKIIPFEE
jgi:hypothetical protein